MSPWLFTPGTGPSSRPRPDPSGPAARRRSALGGCALLDLLDHGRIGERGRVAELALLCDVAQQAAHDLSAPGLRELRREDDVRRLRDRPDLLADVVAQLLELFDRALGSAFERHIGDDRLPGTRIGAA